MISRMGASVPDRIWVQGRDLCAELLGKIGFAEMTWLELTGELPTRAQTTLLEAMLLTLVEHGATPMAIATRLTYMGAPEALQGAVAAGLLGMGTTFAGTAEGSARILQEALSGEAADTPDAELPALAEAIVKRLRETRQPIPGIGHNIHKPVDPRATRLFDLAQEHGLSGRYVRLMQHIAAAAERALNKPGQLPVNATGALGALSSEMGIPWKLCRGLAVIGRSIGIVGHIAEELRNPIAREIWERTEHDASSHVQP